MAIRIEAGSEPIAGYRLIERLGGGGFGEVWKAEAPGGLLKAIKFVYGDLQTEDEDGVRRAEQELKALKRVKSVRHPYLLSLERYDIIDHRLLIVMELADRNLWDRFRDCRSQGLPGIPRDELLRYMEEAAEVLDLMNSEYQLQHLDIKPQNLFLVHNHIKVADFGLVKDLEGMSATVTGGVTPVYAAPETFDGVVSRFCDQYSLAIVYQELLTGQRPFMGSNVQQLIMQHLSGTPNLTPLPPDDRPLIAQALAKLPEDRHPNCGDLVRGLRGGTTPTPTIRPTVSPKPIAELHTAKAARTPGNAGSRLGSEPAPQPAPPTPAPPRPGMGGRYPPARPELPAAPEPTPVQTPRPPRPRPQVPSAIVEPPRVETRSTRTAPPEATGDGILLPAVVIGLGGLGREVILHLRDSVQDRFGSVQALPNLRLLYIDTDADAVQEATQGALGTPWEGREVVLARLNRPNHYLKPGPGRARIDGWFNFKMLYRIPRNPETTGIRSLGRLAFFDNYRAIAGRLQEELEACLAPEALAAADRQTHLGLRSNRPRVYIIAGLAGGTGSGMFLDLAYVARQQLRQLGYTEPYVAGLFLLPAVDREAARTLALGNTYAALTEWRHFSSPDRPFSAHFDEKEGPIRDSGAPFQRVVLLPLPEDRRDPAAGAATALAGDFLFRELATPLGRTAEQHRRAEPRDEELAGQTFGMQRFCWPRRALLQRTARRLCQRLAQQWCARETPAVRAATQSWIVDHWTKHELDSESLIAHLQQACAQALGQAPEDIFSVLLGPLTPRSRRAPELNPAAVEEVLHRLDQLLGRPDDTRSHAGTPLTEALDRDLERLIPFCGKKLQTLAVCLLEQPDYRLAGAEAAVAQLSMVIEQSLEHHEPLYKDLGERAAEAHLRILGLLQQLQAIGGGRRGSTLSADLLEVLRLYPKWRYQSLVLERVIAIYVSLRGQLTEQVREVGFCRQRLSNLLDCFAEPPAGRGSSRPGQLLLPAGARSLEDAIEQVVERVRPEDFKEFDRDLQAMIQQQFTSLLDVCMAKSNLFRNLETAMLHQAEAYLDKRLAGGDVVEMFLNKHAEPGTAEQALADAFEAAVPVLAAGCPKLPAEVDILAVPAGDRGRQVSQLAQTALPEARLFLAESTDEILIYREQSAVPVANLEQVGPAARDAYQQLLNSDTFTPHSRSDVAEWER